MKSKIVRTILDILFKNAYAEIASRSDKYDIKYVQKQNIQLDNNPIM